MYNIQQIIDRYKDKTDRSVMGYLMLGGHDFYLINSDIPLSINSYGGPENFITNELGQVEHYELTGEDSLVTYFRDDETFLIPVTEVEIENENLEYYEDYFPKYNHSPISRHWNGETLDKYFLHPWYPEKEIISFEVIRLIPGCQVGEIIPVNPWNKALFHDLIKYSIEFCLQYP